jgi:glutamate synthase (NADPH/NADH) small chain
MPQQNYLDELTPAFTSLLAIKEASRCLLCHDAPCSQACPAQTDPGKFIRSIYFRNFKGAAETIRENNALGAVCARVCPTEKLCQSGCTRAGVDAPIDIGRLQRFVTDFEQQTGMEIYQPGTKTLGKVAIIGSGPAGLSCAGDLASWGYDVTIFEASHVAGGVLVYGIPQFRLPKEIVANEVDILKQQGVKVMTNMVIGKVLTIDEIMDDMGFEAVFIASGAGLPNFMGIPGESYVGVYSANEYLTRVNLMKAYKGDEGYETPIRHSKAVAVVGGGNVAMDAARCAKRLGAETYIIYRRSEEEMPARLEEIHHAKEEGIIFKNLNNPVQILGDDKGNTIGIECVEMELGEPDASGRRRPIAKEGSNFVLDVDTVIMAIGTSPNPLIKNTTKGLDTNKWGCIVADDSMKTSREGVYAGGDAVTGAATVILAMGAGKTAAKSIDEYIKSKQ